MGAFLGTQCVRCIKCNDAYEAEIRHFLNADVVILTTGMDCRKCGQTQCVGLSYHVQNNLEDVVSKIRSYRNAPNPIFCVHPVHGGEPFREDM